MIRMDHDEDGQVGGHVDYREKDEDDWVGWQ